MYWQDAPRRIWQYNPNMKLIFILRNPIDRAYSHWNMAYVRWAESLPFLQAIRSENVRRRETCPFSIEVTLTSIRDFIRNSYGALGVFPKGSNIGAEKI